MPFLAAFEEIGGTTGSVRTPVALPSACTHVQRSKFAPPKKNDLQIYRRPNPAPPPRPLHLPPHEQSLLPLFALPRPAQRPGLPNSVHLAWVRLRLRRPPLRPLHRRRRENSVVSVLRRLVRLISPRLSARRRRKPNASSSLVTTASARLLRRKRVKRQRRSNSRVVHSNRLAKFPLRPRARQSYPSRTAVVRI